MSTTLTKNILALPLLIAALLLIACDSDSDNSANISSSGNANSDASAVENLLQAGDVSIGSNANENPDNIDSLGMSGSIYCADTLPLNDGLGIPYDYIAREQVSSDECATSIEASEPVALAFPGTLVEDFCCGGLAVDGNRILASGGFKRSFDPITGDVKFEYYPLRLYELSESTELTLTDVPQDDINRANYTYDISGDRIVVANRQENEVYVYEKEDSGLWKNTKLTAGEELPKWTYGSSVAIDGDRVVIGATFNGYSPDFVVHEAGTEALYVYDLNEAGEWIMAEKIVASDFSPTIETGFANWADLDGDRIVTTAGNTRTVCSDSTGACETTEGPYTVYLFEKNSSGDWIETRLMPSGTDSVEFFSSIAIEGDLIAAGASMGGIGDTFGGSGAVLLFRRNSQGVWEENQLIPSDADGGYLFGNDVEIENDVLIVSSPGEAATGRLHGAVYLYRLTDNRVQSETILDYLDSNSVLGKFAYSNQRLIVPEFAVGVIEKAHTITVRDVTY